MRRKTISSSDIPQATRQRFWKRVDRTSVDGCWPWLGAKFRKGYGNFHVPGLGNIGAHIVAFLLESGPLMTLEPKECVLHACDNPPCCRYSHLFAGSKKDNSQDMVRKGRCKSAENVKIASRFAPKGEDHFKAKLTEAAVRAIRAARASGVGQKVLAKQYGVRYQSIQAIDHGRSWKHL